MASSHKPFIISLKFRSVLEKIEKKLSKKNLQEIAFVYEMGDHLKKENKINGLNLFHDIICEGKLDHSDGELISGLVEVLNNLQRTNLARLLIEYCSEWNICYEVSSDQQVSSNTATSTEHPEASVRMSMEQVQDITSTATDDTETSSGDEPQKTQKIVDTVILHRGRRPSKGRPKVNGGACSSSRKRKKQDVGALDERQLSMECYYQSCDEVDDQVEPHDSQDDQYMKQAMDEAKLSPDGDVQVGTVIVNKSEGKVLGRGHNRMPEGCDSLPWGDNEHDPLNSKYPYVFHSSKAALSSAFKTHMSVEGATLYTNLLPANTDAQWIADCGIKEIVYLEDQYKQKLFAVAAKKIFDTRGIKCRRMALKFESVQ